MSNIIVCPSGLTGKIRGLKVREERILADRTLAQQGMQLNELLAACWLETIDAGPYRFDGTINWDDILQGDRFYALLQIRTATYGGDYAFAAACQNEICRRKIEWELNLSDLPVRVLPEESKNALTNSFGVLQMVLPDAKRSVQFKLLKGSDERRLMGARQRMSDRMLMSLLSLRVQQIEGVAANELTAFLEDLSLQDANFLIAAFDRADCGVETAIDIVCPHCRMEQEIELPFERTFFMPARRKQARKDSPPFSQVST